MKLDEILKLVSKAIEIEGKIETAIKSEINAKKKKEIITYRFSSFS